VRKVGIAFLAWIGWCYRSGLVGTEPLSVAAFELIPSLWLPLRWTQLLVLAARVAQDI